MTAFNRELENKIYAELKELQAAELRCIHEYFVSTINPLQASMLPAMLEYSEDPARIRLRAIALFWEASQALECVHQRFNEYIIETYQGDNDRPWGGIIMLGFFALVFCIAGILNGAAGHMLPMALSFFVGVVLGFFCYRVARHRPNTKEKRELENETSIKTGHARGIVRTLRLIEGKVFVAPLGQASERLKDQILHTKTVIKKSLSTLVNDKAFHTVNAAFPVWLVGEQKPLAGDRSPQILVWK